MTDKDAGQSFAERQLAKFGWKKGMGLGRLNDGIAEPIRVKARADNSGIGHDGRENFSHWWDNAYNRAVNKLTVVTSENGRVELKASKENVVSSTKPNLFSSSLLYDNFNQNGTLTGTSYEENVSNCDDSSSEDEAPSPAYTSNSGLLLDLSDDQLLKLCGGRTAHKGARHGIRMTAKMKRLEAMAENDALLVAEWKLKEERHQASKTHITEVAKMPTKLWKNRKSSSKVVVAYDYDNVITSERDEPTKTSALGGEMQQINTYTTREDESTDESVKIKKKKIKVKKAAENSRRPSDEENSSFSDENYVRKTKKEAEDSTSLSREERATSFSNGTHTKKKRKIHVVCEDVKDDSNGQSKKKRKRKIQTDEYSVSTEDKSIGCTQEERKRKRKESVEDNGLPLHFESSKCLQEQENLQSSKNTKRKKKESINF